jgi:hypothetical protein
MTTLADLHAEGIHREKTRIIVAIQQRVEVLTIIVLVLTIRDGHLKSPLLVDLLRLLIRDLVETTTKIGTPKIQIREETTTLKENKVEDSPMIKTDGRVVIETQPTDKTMKDLLTSKDMKPLIEGKKVTIERGTKVLQVRDQLDLKHKMLSSLKA